MTYPRSRNSSKRSSSKPLLLVDFDETLINTAALKRDLFEAVSKAGLPPAAAAQIDAAFRPFSRENYLKLRHSAFPQVRALYRIYNGLFKKPGAYNFPGAERFLAAVSSRYDLWLLTYGDRSIQRKKMSQSNMRRFFKKIIVTGERSKKEELQKLKTRYTELYLLDDEPYVHELALSLGIKSVQIKKGPKDNAYYAKVARRLRVPVQVL